jgi:hypothetical protein
MRLTFAPALSFLTRPPVRLSPSDALPIARARSRSLALCQRVREHPAARERVTGDVTGDVTALKKQCTGNVMA